MTTEKAEETDQLSSDELEKLLGLIKGADSVELKLTVPETDHRSAINALGLDPLDAQIRQIFFFDTPDLQLQQAGLAVRARRVQGRSGDTVVKLRPVVPDDLSEDVRRSAAMNVEVDAMPGGYVCSASMKGRSRTRTCRGDPGRAPRAQGVLEGAARLLHGERARGARAGRPRILGPMFVLKLAVEPKKLGKKLVAEAWLLPDGSRILELSTKARRPRRSRRQWRRARTSGPGTRSETDPQTKTKATLKFFAGKLAEEAVLMPA